MVVAAVIIVSIANKIDVLSALMELISAYILQMTQ